MISQPLIITREDNYQLSHLMNSQMLRKVISDVSIEVDKISKGVEAISVNTDHEVEQAECECCGLREDCTRDYIIKVKDSYSGKWVCGLCSEAVKEKLLRAPRTDMEEALTTHKSFCQEFNTTTRLNPKLSLTCAMRNIAKRSCEKRNSTSSSMSAKIARSSSCVPRLGI